MASTVGSVQDIMDPKHLSLSFDEVWVESTKAGEVLGVVVFFQIVLRKLRNNP